MGILSSLPDMGIVTKLPKSDMGIAVRELFSDAVGIGKDVVTLPFRAFQHHLDHSDTPHDALITASVTPAISALTGVLAYTMTKSPAVTAASAIGMQYYLNATLDTVSHHATNDPRNADPLVRLPSLSRT